MAVLAEISTYAKGGFAPDKESMWTYPATSDGWYRIHNTIRAEMVKFRACLGATAASPLVAWQVSSLQKYWAGHDALVHVHHFHEDKMFTPMLKERVEYPVKLEDDHEALLISMAAVGAAVKALRTGDAVDAVVAAFDAYAPSMKAHLEEEEAICVPLMRAYFEPQYVAKKVAAIMKEMDPVLLGSFIHHQGPKAGMLSFQKQEGIPCVAWYLSFKPKRALYRRQMETHVQALLTGVSPAKPLTAKKDLRNAIACGEFAWKVPVCAA